MTRRGPRRKPCTFSSTAALGDAQSRRCLLFPYHAIKSFATWVDAPFAAFSIASLLLTVAVACAGIRTLWQPLQGPVTIAAPSLKD
jgi:hypothetical protein